MKTKKVFSITATLIMIVSLLAVFPAAAASQGQRRQSRPSNPQPLNSQHRPLLMCRLPCGTMASVKRTPSPPVDQEVRPDADHLSMIKDFQATERSGTSSQLRSFRTGIPAPIANFEGCATRITSTYSDDESTRPIPVVTWDPTTMLR